MLTYYPGNVKTLLRKERKVDVVVTMDNITIIKNVLPEQEVINIGTSFLFVITEAV